MVVSRRGGRGTGDVLLDDPDDDYGAHSELAQTIRRYLDHLAVERGFAANSLAAYRRDLRRYREYLTTRAVTGLAEIDDSTISAFLVALRSGDDEHPPLAASSAARTLVAVRGLHPGRFQVPGHKGGPGADPALRELVGEAGAARSTSRRSPRGSTSAPSRPRSSRRSSSPPRPGGRGAPGS